MNKISCRLKNSLKNHTLIPCCVVEWEVCLDVLNSFKRSGKRVICGQPVNCLQETFFSARKVCTTWSNVNIMICRLKK